VKRATIQTSLRLLLTLALLAGACGYAAGDGGGEGYSYGDATAKNQACLACHGDARQMKGALFINQTQFAHTTHARLGCSTCHGPLPGKHPGGGAVVKADCRVCHTDVSDQYQGSIHAGKTGCAGCHNPHRVEAPREISGPQINQMCGGCHDGFQMTAKHSEWLPQADLHLRMLPCITCHTGSQSYFVSMYIVKGKNGSRFGRQEVASHGDLKRLAEGKDIVSLVDTNGDGFVSLDELRAFNTDPAHKFLRLQGMMTPETVSHCFEILDSRRNCTFCHASGPGRMQTSFLALPEENGTFRRIPVERGAVLDALYGTPDFYLMGSTKNITLNGIGLAIVCGGLIMPVGHGFLRFLTRKNRIRKER